MTLSSASALSRAAFPTLLLIALMMGANHVAARFAFDEAGLLAIWSACDPPCLAERSSGAVRLDDGRMSAADGQCSTWSRRKSACGLGPSRHVYVGKHTCQLRPTPHADLARLPQESIAVVTYHLY